MHVSRVPKACLDVHGPVHARPTERIGRLLTSPRRDHRQASCSVTVPQTPPWIPARGGWRTTVTSSRRESFLQLKAFWKAMQPPARIQAVHSTRSQADRSVCSRLQ